MSLQVPATDTARVQEACLHLGHVICEMVEAALFPRTANQPPPAATQPEPRLRGCRTVFLDRDGTINVRAAAGGYITSAAEISLIPGAAAAIARLNAAEVRVILVTNQRWLSGPAADWTGYTRVHARIEELLAAAGAHLDAAYCCPHPLSSCDCRKPGPGLLQRAAREHRFSLAAAVMIGDSQTDVAAGRAAGTATILLSSGSPVISRDADFVAEDLAAAVRLVLGAGAAGPSAGADTRAPELSR
jgi:D-glycero-D-manno-heptose 1,7-bisphosphate phosphatase